MMRTMPAVFSLYFDFPDFDFRLYPKVFSLLLPTSSAAGYS